MRKFPGRLTMIHWVRLGDMGFYILFAGELEKWWKSEGRKRKQEFCFSEIRLVAEKMGGKAGRG